MVMTMKRFYQSLNTLHTRINKNFKLPPLMSFSLVTLYIILTSIVAYFINYTLIGEGGGSLTDNYFVMVLRTVVIILFINFNIIYLYILVRYFRRDKIPLRVIYSYYAVFSTLLFFIAVILLFSVMFSYYVIGMQMESIFLIFGIAILIILTGANLYPAYFLFLALKEEPVDVFWAIIFCVIGIHLFSYLLFNIWNRIHIFQLWL
jgi:hypothetical protein